MLLQTIQVPVRGRSVTAEIACAPQGQPVPIVAGMANQLQMLALALVALEDPRVDAVLVAFGFEVSMGGEQIFPPG